MVDYGVIARASTKVEPAHNWQKVGKRDMVALTEEERKKAKLIAYGITGAITLGFSSWAAHDAWTRTHSKGRAFGAFLTPPIWLLVR